jgi:hypothetical protein
MVCSVNARSLLRTVTPSQHGHNIGAVEQTIKEPFGQDGVKE